MLEKKYAVSVSADKRVFAFNSIGLKGTIPKLVSYDVPDDNFGIENIYNLGFGDYDPETGFINDLVVTDNGDRDQVLATVASTVLVFLQHYSSASVLIRGSTDARTRLYRMGISKHYEELKGWLDVFGYKDGDWQDFRKNSDYESFWVRRKL